MPLVIRVRPRVVPLVLACAASILSGCSPSSPSPTLAFSVTASPNPISGALCTGCGPASTDREAATTLTIRETGGAVGTLTSIAMTLRNTATGAVIAQGEFTAAAAQAAGVSQLPANGTLNVSLGVHYPGSEQGRAATFTCSIRITDSRGTVVTQEIAVPVSST